MSACPACGSGRRSFWAKAQDVEYRSSEDVFSFFRCEDCAVLYLDPMPADRLREIYPPNYYSYTAPGRSLVHGIKGWLDRRFFRSILANAKGSSLKVLDVGGGAGWELSALRASDARVKETWIVDLDANAEALARQNGHQYFCGRIEDFVTDEKFDLVVLLNLIEHVQDPRAVLSKVASILSPSGTVIVKTPNYDAWDARVFKDRSWAGYHCPRHWVLFTRDSFAGLVESVGLSVKHASYTQGASFWAGSVLAWLASRGLTRITAERPVFNHPLFGITAAAFAGLDFLRRPFAKTSQMFFVLQRS